MLFKIGKIMMPSVSAHYMQGAQKVRHCRIIKNKCLGLNGIKACQRD